MLCDTIFLKLISSQSESITSSQLVLYILINIFRRYWLAFSNYTSFSPCFLFRYYSSIFSAASKLLPNSIYIFSSLYSNINYIGLSTYSYTLLKSIYKSKWVALNKCPILPINFNVLLIISYYNLYSYNKYFRLIIKFYSYLWLNTSNISLWFNNINRQSNVFKALPIILESFMVREWIRILVKGLVLNRWIMNLLFRGRNTISSVITSYN